MPMMPQEQFDIVRSMSPPQQQEAAMGKYLSIGISPPIALSVIEEVRILGEKFAAAQAKEAKKEEARMQGVPVDATVLEERLAAMEQGIPGVDPSAGQNIPPEQAALLQNGIAGGQPMEQPMGPPVGAPMGPPVGAPMGPPMEQQMGPPMMAAGGGLIPGYQNGGRYSRRRGLSARPPGWQPKGRETGWQPKSLFEIIGGGREPVASMMRGPRLTDLERVEAIVEEEEKKKEEWARRMSEGRAARDLKIEAEQADLDEVREILALGEGMNLSEAGMERKFKLAPGYFDVLSQPISPGTRLAETEEPPVVADTPDELPGSRRFGYQPRGTSPDGVAGVRFAGQDITQDQDLLPGMPPQEDQDLPPTTGRGILGSYMEGIGREFETATEYSPEQQLVDELKLIAEEGELAKLRRIDSALDPGRQSTLAEIAEMAASGDERARTATEGKRRQRDIITDAGTMVEEQRADVEDIQSRLDESGAKTKGQKEDWFERRRTLTETQIDATRTAGIAGIIGGDPRRRATKWLPLVGQIHDMQNELYENEKDNIEDIWGIEKEVLEGAEGAEEAIREMRTNLLNTRQVGETEIYRIAQDVLDKRDISTTRRGTIQRAMYEKDVEQLRLILSQELVVQGNDLRLAEDAVTRATEPEGQLLDRMEGILPSLLGAEAQRALATAQESTTFSNFLNTPDAINNLTDLYQERRTLTQMKLNLSDDERKAELAEIDRELLDILNLQARLFEGLARRLGTDDWGVPTGRTRREDVLTDTPGGDTINLEDMNMTPGQINEQRDLIDRERDKLLQAVIPFETWGDSYLPRTLGTD